ncbi:MAG: ribosome maturation factor RimP [Synergistaceae bacterium]|jgi:ribosome maturation factor RimP|nr:ribosome maturation factor RimP [Synergistaceae bacterium]
MVSGLDGAVLKKIAEDTAEKLGYECVWTELRASRGNTILKVYIDTAGGVRHEDCEKVSRTLSECFDAADSEGTGFFPGKYFIEVSSPGIERPLYTEEHYGRFVGLDASVKTGRLGVVSGRIVSCVNGVLVMSTRDRGELSVPFGDIKKGNLAYIEHKGEKKGKKS